MAYSPNLKQHEMLMKDSEGRTQRVTVLVPAMSELIIEKLYDDVETPVYASEGDSGMDVFSHETKLLRSGEKHLFTLGFRMQIPKHPYHALGYRWEAQLRSRSGVAYRTHLIISNGIGTVDNTFVGEVGVLLTNVHPLQYKIEYDGLRAELEYKSEEYIRDIRGENVNGNEIGALGRESDGFIPDGSILVRKGERIAQIVFVQVQRPLQVTIGKVNLNTTRGEGGFGHTGV